MPHKGIEACAGTPRASRLVDCDQVSWAGDS